MTLATSGRPMKRSPKKRKSPTDMAKADVEFSRQIRGSLGGACFAAGERFECGGYIQCCHIISRRYRAIRWDESNARPMCSAHHVWYTHHPLEWEAFIEAALPGLWDTLRHKALFGVPEKPKDALERLRGAA